MANGEMSLMPEEQAPMEEQGMPPQEGPMMDEGQQSQGPPPQDSGELFPANDKEADAIEKMSFEMMYDENIGMSMIDAITNAPTLEEGVGGATAMLMMKNFSAVRQQTGRDIDMNFLPEMVDVIQKEFWRLLYVAKQIKKQPSDRVLDDTGEIALSTLEQMIMGEFETQEEEMAQAEQQQMEQPEQGMAPPEQGGMPPEQGGPSLMM